MPRQNQELRKLPMITINLTDQSGTAHKLEAKAGQALMEPLRDAQLVEATCGGAASCGTCHVFVAADWLSKTGEQTEEEGWMLEALEDEVEIRPDSRLACQIQLGDAHDGLELEIATQL